MSCSTFGAGLPVSVKNVFTRGAKRRESGSTKAATSTFSSAA